MDFETSRQNRREFIKKGTAAVAGIGLMQMSGWAMETSGSSAVDIDGIGQVTNGFNFKTKTVGLNSGYQMPILGIGTYRLSNTQAEESVFHALNNGCRLIDTADIYGNEDGVGKAIKRSGVPRDQLFVTTKLWTADFADADREIDERLQRLGLDYIDLLLLHHPAANDQRAYKAMEAGVKTGKLRSIGLSNYYEEEFNRMMKIASITPAVVQNETHPYYQRKSFKEFLNSYGTILESWYPLGGRGRGVKELLSNSTIADMAKAYGKSSAQVILRWHLQSDIIAIPGSSNPMHIKENLGSFDFELKEADMEKLNALDRRQRFSTY